MASAPPLAAEAEPRFRCSFCPPPPPPPPPPQPLVPSPLPPLPPTPQWAAAGDDGLMEEAALAPTSPQPEEDAGALYERLVLREDEGIEPGGAAASSSAAAAAPVVDKEEEEAAEAAEAADAAEAAEAASLWRPEETTECHFCKRTACAECAAVPGSAASAFVEDAVMCARCDTVACATCLGLAHPKAPLSSQGGAIFGGALDSRSLSAVGCFAVGLRECSVCFACTCGDCVGCPDESSRKCSTCGAVACSECVDDLFDGDAPAPDEADTCRDCALRGDADSDSVGEEGASRRVRARAQAAPRIRLLDVAIGHAAPTFAEFGDELQRLLWVNKEAYGDDQL